jgi:hypothetical protein
MQYPELPTFLAFLTVDYCSMYPIMLENLILPADRNFLDSRTYQNPSTAKTIELLEITQKKNF